MRTLGLERKVSGAENRRRYGAEEIRPLTGDLFTHNWEEPKRKGYFAWAVLFAFLFAGLFWLARGLLAGGFATGTATHIQSLVDTGAAAESAYPLIPYLVAEWLAKLPLGQAMAPYAVDALAAALLLGVGYQRMVNAGVGAVMALALILAIVLNPIFLFVATSGSGIGLALILVYVFLSAMKRLGEEKAAAPLILLFLSSYLLMLTTPLGFYFLIVASPFLFLAGKQSGRTGVAVIATLIPFLAITALLLTSPFLADDPAGLMRQVAGGVAGPRDTRGLEPWAFMMGENLPSAAIVLAAGTFIAFPALALALTGVFAGASSLRLTAILAGIIVITGTVTTYLGVLSHPAFLWVFAVPALLLALQELRGGALRQALAVATLIGGLAGSWWLLGLHPTLSLTVWRDEISGQIAHVTGLGVPAAEAHSLHGHWESEDDAGQGEEGTPSN